MAEIDKRIADELWARMERKAIEALTGTEYTFTTAAPPLLDLRAMVETMRKFVLNARRHDVTFVVDEGHEGDAIMHRTETEGARIECNWTQANIVHQTWPLKLHEVKSETVAEFVPVSGVFPEFVPKVLPMPPYDLPSDDDGGDET